MEIKNADGTLNEQVFGELVSVGSTGAAEITLVNGDILVVGLVGFERCSATMWNIVREEFEKVGVKAIAVPAGTEFTVIKLAQED